ncbi:MAG: hypothetical protein NC389_12560 [Acetatifactor muris]|nr:hypothetical protein [Acetatifactor muris]
MEAGKINYELDLDIDGMGLVLYSEGAVQELEEGENFFQRDYSTPEQVAAHIKKGDIVGFCTGSPGRYHIKFREGYPDERMDGQYPVAIRLALDVKGGRISIIDLFWLMEWSHDCPPEQQLCVEDGIYHLTVLTAKPASGIWGDNQEIHIYMQQLDTMPELAWEGVPPLFV